MVKREPPVADALGLRHDRCHEDGRLLRATPLQSALPPRSRPPREADRLSRPQPPRPIPPRVRPTPTPGMVAYPLLGARVVK